MDVPVAGLGIALASIWKECVFRRRLLFSAPVQTIAWQPEALSRERRSDGRSEKARFNVFSGVVEVRVEDLLSFRASNAHRNRETAATRSSLSEKPFRP